MKFESIRDNFGSACILYLHTCEQKYFKNVVGSHRQDFKLRNNLHSLTS